MQKTTVLLISFFVSVSMLNHSFYGGKPRAVWQQCKTRGCPGWRWWRRRSISRKFKIAPCVDVEESFIRGFLWAINNNKAMKENPLMVSVPSFVANVCVQLLIVWMVGVGTNHGKLWASRKKSREIKSFIK